MNRLHTLGNGSPARRAMATTLVMLWIWLLLPGTGHAQSPTAGPTVGQSPTSVAQQVATNTPVPTATATRTPTATATRTPTATLVPTSTATRTPTATPSATATTDPVIATAVATALTATVSAAGTQTAVAATATGTMVAATATAAMATSVAATATAASWTLTPSPTPVPADTATPEPTATPQAPPNDDYDTATTFGFFSYSESLNTWGATVAWDDPNMGAGYGQNGATVWYRFVVPSAGRIRLETFGSDYDTVAAVYTGYRGALALVTANDDVVNPRETYYASQSELSFDAQPGITYSLEVASRGTNGGNLRLLVEFSPGAQVATPTPLPTSTPYPTAVPTALPLVATLPPVAVPADDRYFAPTGYRISSEPTWDYFQKRGGIRTFGYPVSRPFTLLGFPVQFFQRGILQVMADGSVARMNLLDEGLMPYTQINFSVFPAPDPELVLTAPSPSDPSYGEKAIAFLQSNVPDQWDGQRVGFLQTFLSTVRYEDAFPLGDGEPALLPLLNLELWGLPTSRPAYDPSNGNFVYQRFQRGIMHYDALSGATGGLLLADYLKAILTGQNLPPDLDLQARNSPFYRQYDQNSPGWTGRPWELPASDLVGAFEPELTR